MTDNNENNLETVNDVVEKAVEVAEQVSTEVQNDYNQSASTVIQGSGWENHEQYATNQDEYVTDQGGHAVYGEGNVEESFQQNFEPEKTQSFAEKIDLDEKVAATKNFFGEFWNYIKVCFTQSFPQGVKGAATEKTPFWVVIMVANALFMGLCILVGFGGILYPSYVVVGGYGRIMALYPNGLNFLMGLLASLVFFWASVGGVAGLLAICKKNFSFQGICNVVAVAMIPLTLILAASILLGALYIPLAMILISIGNMMFFILLYMGVQSMAKFQKSPFIWFSLMELVVMIVYVLVLGMFTNALS